MTATSAGSRAAAGLSARARRRCLWQLGYLLAALLYAGLVIYWGRHDMSRMHREYRQAATRLAGNYAVLGAEREVAAGCRQSVAGAERAYGDCLRAAESLVMARAAVINRELRQEKRQMGKKLAIFYAMFSLLLIMLPVAGGYVVLLVLLQLYAAIRAGRERSE